MLHFIHGQTEHCTGVHAWDKDNPFSPGFFLALPSGELLEFKTTDDMINWLFLNNYKDTARALNQHIKQG